MNKYRVLENIQDKEILYATLSECETCLLIEFKDGTNIDIYLDGILGEDINKVVLNVEELKNGQD